MTPLLDLKNEIGLRPLLLKSEYNTEEDKIIKDFYSPCLSKSNRYDRAVGFFRANIYRELGEPLLNFVLHGGKIRLICSPDIPEIDENAVREGYRLRGQRSTMNHEISLIRIIREMSQNPDERDCLDMLCLLIETEAMELYIATRPGGIYHRKIGIFYDNNGDFIAFSGSGNETARAISGIEDWSNDEEFDIFRSWGTDFETQKAQKKVIYFNKLIANGSKNTQVRPLNHIERDEIAKYRINTSLESCREGARKRSGFNEKDKTTHQIITSIKPYYYQQQAIDAWKNHNRIGMLSMATGTGKTYTALFAISELIEQGKLVVILVPSKILLNQWYEVVNGFYSGIPILLAGGGHNWKENPLKRMFVSKINKPRFIIATMDTASSDDFIDYLSQAKEPVLIADEAHRIGSPTYRRVLNMINFKEKLGLSATPERLFDTEGDNIIKEKFGQISVYNLPIDGKVRLSSDDHEEVPILGKFLTRYNYYFEIVKLSDNEQNEWRKLSTEISRFIVSHPDAIQSKINFGSLNNNKKLELLLIQRARILKKAQGKIDAAIKVIAEKYKSGSRWIIYCEDEEQMNQVAEALRTQNNQVTSLIYHSDLSDDERERTLQFFESHPSIIISIRCLDEGIDIPAVDGALILASSTNPRQYIQRRGRVLRKAKGKRRATIVDTLVLPNDEESGTEYIPIIRSEISRAWNFAKNAENSDITHELWIIGSRYNSDIIEDQLISIDNEN